MRSNSVNTRADYIRHLVELPRSTKRIISICTDAVMIPLALWAAVSLKAGRPSFEISDWPAYAAVVALSIPVFIKLGLYRAVIRFLGHHAVFAVAFAIAVSGVLLGLMGLGLGTPTLSWSMVAIFSVWRCCMSPDRALSCATTCLPGTFNPRWPGSPFTVPERRVQDYRPFCRPRVRSTPWYSSTITGSLQGRMVNGIEVFSPDHLPGLIKDRKIDRILLALPSLSRRRRLEILSKLEPLACMCKPYRNSSSW